MGKEADPLKFHLPTHIIFGSGITPLLKDIIDEMEASRLFLITDKGIVKAGLLEKITSIIGKVDYFDGIEPNPKSETVNKIGALLRQNPLDLIVALGGGSCLDAGKAAALLATNQGIIEDYEGKEKYIHDPLPVVAVPTTCGTGSEVTWVAVITDVQRKFKMSIKGKKMFPAVALVDPDLLTSLPKPVIASTGLDAFTHAIEAYTSKAASIITDNLALKAVKLISSSLTTCYKDIKRAKVSRENLMMGSLMAGMAFGNSDVGAVHCLAESIGALFDVPHGVANAIFLPYVMEFNLPACLDKYAQIAEAFGLREENAQKAATKLIEEIRSLSRSLNIPFFKRLGIDESQFLKIAEYSCQNNSNPSNPRPVTNQDYLSILKAALADS